MSSAEKENRKDVSKKTESRRIATPKQIEFLIDFLRDNDQLRSSRVQRSKEAIYIGRQLWDLCAQKLNRMGPARNAKEWAKYWSDLKSRTKQKNEEINIRACNAGEGSSNVRNLSYAETRIIRLLEHDEQMKNGHEHEVPLDQSSGGSSQESMVYTIKEEKEDENIEALEMNVEDFISIAPVVDDITGSPLDKLPPLQPATNHRSINISLPLPASLQPPLISLHPPNQGPYPPTQGPQPSAAGKVELSPIIQNPSVNNLQSGDKKQPRGGPPTLKRRRRKARLVQSHTNRSCLNPECINCIELKEFCDVMLRLEESHAKTTKLQTEASLKMTEVLKLQAEGILHTGVALREMATNLCRLMEGQALSGRTITM
ncbi:hypothetical protein O0L34_g9901 [Tuta absoluta]|nr:hypothetical protein O0L34_g9901 [Tuta absoluta]